MRVVLDARAAPATSYARAATLPITLSTMKPRRLAFVLWEQQNYKAVVASALRAGSSTLHRAPASASQG